jgi:hypothetical protein
MRNTITKLITLTMAVAAIAVIGSSWAAGRAGAADQPDGGLQLEITHSLRGAPYGIIPGQSLSFSVANTRTQEEGGGTVRVTSYTYDSTGNLMRQTDPVEVPPGQFRTLKVKREDLRVAGEPGTGRVEVQTDFQFQADANQSFSGEDLRISLELVNNLTGGTISYVGSLGLAAWWSSSPLNPPPAPRP